MTGVQTCALPIYGVAYSQRAVGNLARPFLPDGIDGNPNGPLSKPFGQWSPFSDGLQLDLVFTKVVQNLAGGGRIAGPCSTAAEATNGIQIFPGAVPIYRGATLVGAIGISGDGIDQDDMVALAQADIRNDARQAISAEENRVNAIIAKRNGGSAPAKKPAVSQPQQPARSADPAPSKPVSPSGRGEPNLAGVTGANATGKKSSEDAWLSEFIGKG